MDFSDVLLIQKYLFASRGNFCTQPRAENESAEYSACEFDNHSSSSAALNGPRLIKFRKAKITPTKIGQFVTLWKRDALGKPIRPFETADGVDSFVVATRDAEKFGAFVFPADVIIKLKKLAIRVYPPWDVPTSPQALRTQKWQASYFTTLPPNE